MRKLLLLLSILWATSLQAQQIKFSLSLPGDKVKDSEGMHKYGKFIYSHKVNWGKMQFAFSTNLKKVKYGVELSQYDELMNETKTLKLDNGEKNFGPYKPMFHYGKDAIYIMYFKFPDDGNVKMYVTKVNPDSLTVMYTRELMEYDQKNTTMWGAFKSIDETESLYTVSENGKYAWIIHACPTMILSTVIDADLNIVQPATNIPVTLKKLRFTGVHMGNDGNKLLAYIYDDPAVPLYFTRGLFFQAMDGKAAFKTVKLPEGYHPGSIVVLPSKDGKKCYFAGEYSGEDYAKAGQGVMLGEIDLAAQILSSPTFYPYTPELRQRVYDLDFAYKKKGEIIFTDAHLHYRVNEMDNGTIVLSADMNTAVSTPKITFYYSGPVIHVFIKPGGNASMTLIPKKQPQGSPTGFFNYVYKDKLICIYADDPKYLEKEYDDKKIRLERYISDLEPVVNVYDSDGKLISRKALVENIKEMKGYLCIGNSSKLNNNTFMFPVAKTTEGLSRYGTTIKQVGYLEIF